MALRHLNDLSLIILLGAALINTASGVLSNPATGWLEGSILLLLVLMILNMAALADYLNALQFYRMSIEGSSEATVVIRGGTEMQISKNEIVVGDVLFVMSGDTIEVDGLLVRSFGITVNEKDVAASELPVSKSIHNKGDPFLLAGSQVIDGSGLIVVCAVGKNSNLAKRLNQTTHIISGGASPVQQHLEIILIRLVKLGVVLACVLFCVLMLYLLIEVATEGTGDFLYTFLNTIELSLSLLVIAVPESMPIAVTLSVFVAASRLHKEKCYLRSLETCATLGSIDSIIIDKTGLLTKNTITVKYTYIGGIKSEAPAYSTIPPHLKQIAAECLCRNNHVVQDAITGHFTGDHTECGLLEMVKEWGYNIDDYRDPNKHIAQIPISVQDNKNTCFYKDEGQMKVYTKGNDSLVLSRCSHYLDGDGQIQPLTIEKTREIIKEVKNLITGICISTLSLSFKTVELGQSFSDTDFIRSIDDFDEDMVYIGSIAIEDQPNSYAYYAVLNLLKSATRLFLVTNDDFKMAQYIAEESTLTEKIPHFDPDTFMSGEEFAEQIGYSKDPEFQYNESSLQKLREITQQLVVIYKATPEDRLMLVLGLKELGHIIASTGVSMNDSKAIKAANVGIALTLSSVLVKENADALLANDSIFSLESMVKHGRNINKTILKYLKYQLSLTYITIIVMLVASISLFDNPLAAIQVLVITMILGVSFTMCICFEPAEEHYTHIPKITKEKFLTDDYLITLYVQTGFQVLIILGALLTLPFITEVEPGWNIQRFSDEYFVHYSAVFCVFAYMGLYHMLNARTVYSHEWNIFRNITKNKLFLANWIFLYIFIIIVIEVLGTIFHATPLSFLTYLLANCCGISALLVDLATKMVIYYSRSYQDEETKPLLQHT